MPNPLPATFKIPRPESNENLAWEVVSVMWEHANFYEDEATYRQSIAPATPGQLAVYACGWYLSEVYNGGHDQFFFNSTGMVWRDALAGFRLLGATEYGTVLGQAVAQFPNSNPSLDRSERETQMEAIASDVFDGLDQRIYDLEGAFDTYATKYILAHPADFFMNP